MQSSADETMSNRNRRAGPQSMETISNTFAPAPQEANLCQQLDKPPAASVEDKPISASASGSLHPGDPLSPGEPLLVYDTAIPTGAKMLSPRPPHRRNVSWEQRPDGHTEDAPRTPLLGVLPIPNLQQPELSPLNSLASAAPPNEAIGAGPGRRDYASASLLGSLHHPFESEAEAYILRAVEGREAVADGRAPDANPPSGLPGALSDQEVRLLSDGASLGSLGSDTARSRSGRPPRSAAAATAATDRSNRRRGSLEDRLFGLASRMESLQNLDVAVEEGPVDVPQESDFLASHPSLALSSITRRSNPASLNQSNSRLHQQKEAAGSTAQLHPKKVDDRAVSEESYLQSGSGDLTGEGLVYSYKSRRSLGSDNNHKQLKIFSEWKVLQQLEDYWNPMKGTIVLYVKIVLVIMVVFTCISAILFYLSGNPPTGVLVNGGRPINGTLYNTKGVAVNPNLASLSWWFLFIFVRQLITLSMAVSCQLLIIDCLLIRSQATLRFFGAWPTLFLLQSRGWPFVVFWWCIFDFVLLSGRDPFFSHWLYWQDAIELFNQSNPAGNVVDSQKNHRLVAVMLAISLLTVVKRFWVGLALGRQTYNQFSERLATLMNKILLVSEVAAFSKDALRDSKSPRNKSSKFSSPRVLSDQKLKKLIVNNDIDAASANVSEESAGSSGVIDNDDRHPLTGTLNAAQKNRISDLLGEWEEPVISDQMVEPVSVSGLLQFRRALVCLRTDYPFSGRFGPAGTREQTIASSQDIFSRLLLYSETYEERLDFDVLALLGVLPDGSLDQVKIKDLIKVFRPDRDGKLSLIDFVKSVDAVYRELRLLRASVANASKIDAAFESILSIIFYAAIFTILLLVFGFDAEAIFLSISGVVLAFAFMIGPASSKYFEGLLFILIRRPYAIGDGIHASDPNDETAGTGSGWWLVEDVTLFTTSVVFMFTNERATLSNGSLASSRIINSTRSPHPCMNVRLQFPIDVPYKKLEIFHRALDEFVLNRPREWIGGARFRVTNVDASLGFVEYIVVVNHRESWAQWGLIHISRGHLAQFCIELAKQLDISYRSPPLPVNLNVGPSATTALDALRSGGGSGTGAGASVGANSTSAPGHGADSLGTPSQPPRSVRDGDDATYAPVLRRLQEAWAPKNQT